MTRSLTLLAGLGLLATSGPPASGETASRPALEIFSRLGAEKRVRVFNDERLDFFAREKGGPGGRLLRDVAFVLYEEGGRPDRSEDVRATSRDRKTWGRPPSTFSHPVAGRVLPVGAYRLRAEKRGFRAAEIRLVVARFSYYDLATEHTKDAYRATLRLRLADRTEKRPAVPVTVKTVTRGGALLDSASGRLVPEDRRTGHFRSSAPVRLSSRLARPDRSRPPSERRGVLKVVEGSRLVVVLDGLEFSYPVPLPPEVKRGTGSPGGSDQEGPRSSRSR